MNMNFRRWQAFWNRPLHVSPWMNRGVSAKSLAAVVDGWLNPGGLVVDLGCGEGEVSHWLAQQGFHTVGVDIAPATIARARARRPEIPGKLELRAQDLCAQPLPLRNVHCFVDRGCFHTVPPSDVGAYVGITAAAAPDAPLRLFVRAFREDAGRSETDERAEIEEKSASPPFRLISVAKTNLGGFAPDGSQHDRLRTRAPTNVARRRIET